MTTAEQINHFYFISRMGRGVACLMGQTDQIKGDTEFSQSVLRDCGMSWCFSFVPQGCSGPSVAPGEYC